MMAIILQIILLVIGFVLLAKGADIFVDGAVGIAKRLGLSELVIGLTIVAMGTSAPEAAVCIASAAKGNADIAIGNVFGSNILNICIVLGVTAVIAILAVQKETIRRDLPIMLAVTVVFLLLGLDGKIGRADGIIFLVIFVAYLVFLMRSAQKEHGTMTQEEQAAEKGKEPVRREVKLPRSILMAAVGLVMIIFGSQFAVDAATEIALFAGVSERFVGLTIVALGTSLPELFICVMAARKGSTDIAIGNIVGSNLFNLLFVAGLSATIVPINFAASFRVDAAFAIAAAVILFLFAGFRKKVGRGAGIVFLAVYAVYFIQLL